MDSQAAPLTTDIQRALQHAVGEANNAFAHSNNVDVDVHKKKKKKHRHEHDGAATEQSEVQADQPVKEKKKKRKRREEDTQLDELDSSADAGNLDVTGHVDQDEPRQKKSKHKGASSSQEPPSGSSTTAPPVAQSQQDMPIDPQLTSETSSAPSQSQAAQSQTAIFLNALVAAASSAWEEQGHPPPSFRPGQFNPGQPGSLADEFNPGVYADPTQYADQIPLHVNGGPILPSEFAFGSNEEILRALSDLDMSKIVNVIKTLGDAASASSVPVNIPAFAQHISHPAPSETSRTAQPPTSNGTAGRGAKAAGKRRLVDVAAADPNQPQHTHPDHAQLLCTKWMNATRLNELAASEGLIYKKGKFSAIEEQQLANAIENFRVNRSLTPEQVNSIIFPNNETARDQAFWSEITAALPLRPIIAVYHHVRRTHHPMKQRGKWNAEEDKLLQQAVTDLGPAWEKVSIRVGRMSSDCRDRYRNHIANRDVRVTGSWTTAEEDELTKIVTELTIQQGRDPDTDVFWGVVSDRMGNKRGRQQCRIKWTDALSKRVKNHGKKPRWSPQDAYILVHKVDSLDVRDDTEIDWKTLSDPNWNLWSGHVLQCRWLTMKRSIKGHEDMTHQEIMDILRVKKAQLPTVAPVSNRKKKTVTSAASVHEGDEEEAEAGPSSGPGTLLSTAT